MEGLVNEQKLEGSSWAQWFDSKNVWFIMRGILAEDGRAKDWDWLIRSPDPQSVGKY